MFIGAVTSRVSQGVPLSRPTGRGTMGQDGTVIISLKNRGGKQWVIIHYRNIKERQHGIPVRIAGTDVPLPTTWTKAVRPFTRQSADATTKAAAGISLYAQTVFSRPPRMPDRRWFLFRQTMYGAEAQATAATDSHRLHTVTLCGEIAERA